MGNSEDENLKVFYRAMTTEQLLLYRAALDADSTQAPGRRQTILFCRHRRKLVADVLRERGVEALN
jgi:hypothetical protein